MRSPRVYPAAAAVRGGVDGGGGRRRDRCGGDRESAGRDAGRHGVHHVGLDVGGERRGGHAAPSGAPLALAAEAAVAGGGGRVVAGVVVVVVVVVGLVLHLHCDEGGLGGGHGGGGGRGGDGGAAGQQAAGIVEAAEEVRLWK